VEKLVTVATIFPSYHQILQNLFRKVHLKSRFVPEALNFDIFQQRSKLYNSKTHHLHSIAHIATTMPSEEPPTDRAALVNRQLPEMALSDGSPSSNTYPSNPPSSAEERFRVRGTAVRT
jgi:hypothetical protein